MGMTAMVIIKLKLVVLVALLAVGSMECRVHNPRHCAWKRGCEDARMRVGGTSGNENDCTHPTWPFMRGIMFVDPSRCVPCRSTM